MRLRILLTLCLLGIVLPVAHAGATTFTPNRFDDPAVGGDSCAPPPPANGCSLRGAIAAAKDGDTIDLAGGEYTLTQGELEALEEIEILGDGPSATTIRQTTANRVFTTNAGVTMVGLTITGGHVEGGDGAGGGAGANGEDGFSGSGGGISASGLLTLDNVVLTGNGAFGGDGGDGGDNAAGGGGAGGRGGSGNGAGISGGPLFLIRVTISDNVAQPGAAGDGGDATGTGGDGGVGGKGGAGLGAAIAAGGNAVTIVDSAIVGNEALTTPGGEGGHGGSLSGASGAGGQGEAADAGGVFGNGVVRLTNVTLTGNVAEGGVGGRGGEGGGVLPTTGGTGGVALGGGGGAVALFNGAVGHFASVTFAGNTATAAVPGEGGAGSGGGEAGVGGLSFPARGGNVLAASAEFTTRGSIFAAGSAGPGEENCGFSGSGELEGLGHNLDDGEGCFPAPEAGDLSNASAGLGPLQDNGGPTQTMALLAGSQAIDAGEPACVDAAGSPLTTDQRGEPRGSPCDIGAYEVQPEAAKPEPPQVITPNLYRLRVKPPKVPRNRKATIAFRLNVKTKVSFKVKRKLWGVKVGKKCLKRSAKHPKGKRCKRLVKAKSRPKGFAAAKAGQNKRTWTPRKLAPGKYKLFAKPAGGVERSISFVVLKPRR